jgi:anti-sigma-K factor RskA
MRCADKTLLAAWVDGELEAADERAVAEHAEHCRRCAADVREQRLVKWRTAHLSADEPIAPRPDLLHQLLTVPSMEYSRQSQARRACGTGSTRWAGIAVGAGVGVSMATVAWLAPMSTSGAAPTVARVDSPSSVVPVMTPYSSSQSSRYYPSGSSSALSPGSSSGLSSGLSLGVVPVGAGSGQYAGTQPAVPRDAADAR